MSFSCWGLQTCAFPLASSHSSSWDKGKDSFGEARYCLAMPSLGSKRRSQPKRPSLKNGAPHCLSIFQEG